MKKILSCILVLAMFLSLGLGSALADTPKEPVGSYVLTGLVIDETDYTDLIKSANLVFTLELREDGTGLLVTSDEELELTWDEENIYADDGIPVPYTYEDGVLVMEEEDMTMTFEKTEQLPEKTAGTEGRSIVDTWVGTLDIKGFITEIEPDLGNLMEKAPVSITLEMKEDGSYVMDLDASPMLPNLRMAMFGYLEELCEENGVTVEQLEESYGKSLDEVVDEALEDLDLSEINQTVEGIYEESNGQVIWDKGTNETRGLYTGDTLVFSLEDFGEVLLTRAGVYGIWTADVDFSTVMGEADEGLAEALKDVTVQLELDLRSDNSFILSMDAEEMLPALRVGLTAYVEAMLEEQGMTTEEFESLTGQSLDALLDEAFKEFDMDELNKSVSGTYELKDDTIILRAEDLNMEEGKLQGSKLCFDADDVGTLEFVHIINEDVLAKGEGVMSYAEYDAAELDSEVVIEAYVMAHQSWWDDKITVYAQDADGGYFIYDMACSEKDAKLLVPGQKIRVTGYKSEWSGQVEIIDGSFSFVRGSYAFPPLNITEVWGTVDMIQYQNRFVSFKGATVEPYDESGAAFVYKDAEGKTDDLYFKVTIGDTTYEFVVEYYLCDTETDVYKAVENLHVGDVINLEGYLCWYNGPNLHTTSVTVRQAAED